MQEVLPQTHDTSFLPSPTTNRPCVIVASSISPWTFSSAANVSDAHLQLVQFRYNADAIQSGHVVVELRANDAEIDALEEHLHPGRTLTV